MYLEMIERELKRPIGASEAHAHFPEHQRPSARAVVVLLFWTYFETRIERLLRTALRELPDGLVEDALGRHFTISARLNRFYKVLFGATYFDDLNEMGFAEIAKFVQSVRERRNSFAHGEPQAINDSVVERVVENLKIEHESWIAVFNRRAALPVPRTPTS